MFETLPQVNALPFCPDSTGVDCEPFAVYQCADEEVEAFRPPPVVVPMSREDRDALVFAMLAEGRSFSATAEALGIPRGTVSSIVWRARVQS